MNVSPYLYFEGRCDEAIAFYKKTLGIEVTALSRFKDAPKNDMCPPGGEDKVMHMTFRLGDLTVMASDGRCSGKAKFDGFSLSLAMNDTAKAEKAFAALGEGGQVVMPMASTFFAKKFGMLADQFGLMWLIFVPV